MIHVSVLIPTFRRPEFFLRAARSVLAQQGVDGIELIAIDNSPEGSAIEAFRALERETTLPFRWAHEPKPGVAQARNAAVKIARGDLVAWLDDDEEAPAHWLAALLAVRRATGAQSVFGPVRAMAPAGAPNVRFHEALYSRTGPTSNGCIERAYGIGNSMQPRLMFEEPQPFDPRANQTGGEDDVLFASWAEAGARFAWAADAWVIEHISAERTKLKHGLKRAFAYGQGPCETAWAAHDYTALVRHMLIGAGQLVAFGAAALIAFAGSTPRALTLLDRAARGAGKVFWFFEQRFYGETLARQPA